MRSWCVSTEMEHQALSADSSRGNIKLTTSEVKIEWRKHCTLVSTKDIPDIKNRLLYQPNEASGQSDAELARLVILIK